MTTSARSELTHESAQCSEHAAGSGVDMPTSSAAVGGRGAKPAPTPVPWCRLSVAFCVVLSESIGLNILFPFVPSLVRSFGYTDSATVSFLSSMLAGSFGFAEFLSSFFWGYIADRIGRRPTILICLSGAVVGIITFGSAGNLAVATVARFINGAFNGGSGVARTYVREVTDESNQAGSFAIMGVAWSVGGIIGPLAGGFLATPHETIPWLAPEGSVFAVRPFLLPCLLAATISFAGLCVGFVFLRETLPHPVRPRWWLSCQRTMRGVCPSCCDRASPGDRSRAGAKARSSGGGGCCCRSSGSKHRRLEDSDDADVDVEVDGEAVDVELAPLGSLSRSGEDGSSPSTAVSTAAVDVSVGTGGGKSGDLVGEGEDEAATMLVVETPYTAGVKRTPWQTLRLVMSMPGVGWGIAGMGIVMYVFVSLQELFPLWSSSPIDEGGLGFSTADIGLILFPQSAVMLMWTCFGLSRLERRIGVFRMFVIACAVYGPIAILMPFAHSLIGVPPLKVASLLVLFSLRGMWGPTLFTAGTLLINNAATSDLGAVNGLMSACTSIGRTVGASTGGVVLGWAQAAGLPFPFDYHLPFLCVGLLMLVNLLLATRFPDVMMHRQLKTSATS